MHDTRSTNTKCYIDEYKDLGEKIFVRGWILSPNKKESLQVICDGSLLIIEEDILREDVAKFYGIEENRLGFSFELPKKYVEANLICEEVIFKFPEDAPQLSNSFDPSIFNNNNEWKSFICVDNFYDNPDAVRSFALSQKFEYHQKYHKGKRTDFVFRPESLKLKFEKLIGKKIISWDQYNVNGCFQHCTAEDQIVYHYDTQNYAGVVYLTPAAPVESGTTFFKSRVNGLMKLMDSPLADATGKSFGELAAETFKTGFYDSTQFERVDVVGNVYNRLVLWDAKLLHAATSYFGTDLYNSRLFHLFFFDVEK